MNSLLKNSKKIFTDAPDIDSGLTNRVTTLENNEYKIIYFTEISNSAGSITIPTGATILLDQFQAGVDAYVSTIQNGQPTGDFPKTSGGTTVDVTSFDSLGNYTLSGTPSSYPVALIYVFKIKAKDYNNLNINKILDLEGSSLPNQAGQGGKYLTTDGSTASWASVSGGGLLSGTATGTNNYSVTITGVTSYTNGDAYVINFTNGNDADSTININGLGVKNLVKEFNVQVTGGDIVSGQELLLIYDGTNFQCIGVAPNQLFAYVTNDDSVTINKGQPVYAFGAAGNRMSVKLANNTSDSTSAQTVGVVFSSSIAPNQRGFIITQGVINGLNTAAYSPGDQLYLGPTAGSLTNVKPYAPNHLVYIGIVERANAGNGQIYIKPQNGYELDELHDIDLKSVGNIPGNNDVLTYVTGVNNLWKPRSITTILGYTPENVSNKSTTTTLGTSDTLYPTQNAVKTYVDAQVATVSQAAKMFNYYNFI
jgi:hypothetical protein